MDSVTTGNWKVGEIKRINFCRIYKGVTVVSDLVNKDGKYISHNFWTNEKNSGDLPFWRQKW